YGYVPPAGYSRIVRSATFNALLVDTGFLGIVLFAGVFGIVAMRVLRSNQPVSAVAVGSLAMIAASMFVSLNYDVVLLYLALMPCGALMSLVSQHRRDQR